MVAPSLYIIVVSAVSDSMSVVSMTVSEAVDGHPTAESTVAAVAVVFRSVSDWLLDHVQCAPSTGRPVAHDSTDSYPEMDQCNTIQIL